MTTVERVVRVADTSVRIVGQSGDGFVEKLPDTIRETALDYASAVLPPDGVVLDVGANVGLLTIGFSLVVPDGQVVAFEPSPQTYQHLRQTVELAMGTNMVTFNVAISDRAGELEFFENSWFSAGSFVKEAELASTVHRGSVFVPARTLDDVVAELGLTRLDLVKIDVEGHELKVLQGASDVIARFRPSFVIEMNLFTTTSFGDTLPLEFLLKIRSIFPHVYEFRHGEEIAPIDDESDMYQRVQHQFLCGRPSDLICRFDPLPAEIERQLSDSSVSIPHPTLDDLHAQLVVLRGELAERDVTISQLRAELVSRQQALTRTEGEIAALRHSNSWKVTAPLRSVADHVRR